MTRDIKFCYKVDDMFIQGDLLYKSEDYAFFYKIKLKDEFDKYSLGGLSSLSFDTLELFVGLENKMILFPHGYFPNTSFEKRALPEIEINRGVVFVDSDIELSPGIATVYSESRGWKRYYDNRTGWIYFGPKKIDFESINIEFANNAVVSLSQNRIVSLWFNPKIVP